jgi:hypothetical protein
MVSFKFNTSKVANFTTDVPSKHGFQLKDFKEEKEKYINLIDITTKI